jgi:hypothetical protein
MAELAQRRRSRAPHRSTVTKRVQEVNRLLADIDGGSPPDVDRLEGIKATLRDKLTYPRQLDEEIEKLIVDETDLETEVQQSEDIAESINTAMAGLNRVLRPPPPTPTSTALGPSPHSGGTTSRTTPRANYLS